MMPTGATAPRPRTGTPALSPRTPAPGPRPRAVPGPPPLVLVAHGSRDPRTPAAVAALLTRVRALAPRLPVRLAHLELNAPTLPEVLGELPPGLAVLVPLLLGRGYHSSHDIPAAAARAAHLGTAVAPPLGPHPLLTDALRDRLHEAGWRRSARGAVVLAAAGSRDPAGTADTVRAAGLLAAGLGVPVTAAYASATRPTVAEAVRELRAAGHRDTAVASYFTAPGRFAAQCAAAPALAAAPLGAHPAVARLLLHRYTTARATLPVPVPH
ncbi:sirohydrochlorin chelatase [Streptomyces sp. NPDC050560]|uniref:sirohydrochlorin chelatase n=1 Tax=Streptomyces sp. NPDC050560 TaxID=3365630 RepID=UPI0037A543CB